MNQLPFGMAAGDEPAGLARVFAVRADGLHAVGDFLSFPGDPADSVPVTLLPSLIGVDLDRVLAVVADIITDPQRHGLFAKLTEDEAVAVGLRFGAALFVLNVDRKEGVRGARQHRPTSDRLIHEVLGLAADEPCTNHKRGSLHLTDFEESEFDRYTETVGRLPMTSAATLVALSRRHLSGNDTRVGASFSPKPDPRMRLINPPRVLASSILDRHQDAVRQIRLWRGETLMAEVCRNESAIAASFAGLMIATVFGQGEEFADTLTDRSATTTEAKVAALAAHARTFYNDDSIRVTLDTPDKLNSHRYLTEILTEATERLGDELWRAHLALPVAEVERVLGTSGDNQILDTRHGDTMPLILGTVLTIEAERISDIVYHDRPTPGGDQSVGEGLVGWERSRVPNFGELLPTYVFPTAIINSHTFASHTGLPPATFSHHNVRTGDQLTLVPVVGAVSITFGEPTPFSRRDLADFGETVRGDVPSAEFTSLWVDGPVVEAMAQTAARPVWLDLELLPSMAGVAWLGRELIYEVSGASEHRIFRLEAISWLRRSPNELALIVYCQDPELDGDHWFSFEAWVNPMTGDGEFAAPSGTGRLIAALFNLLALPRTTESSIETLTSESRDLEREAHQEGHQDPPRPDQDCHPAGRRRPDHRQEWRHRLALQIPVLGFGPHPVPAVPVTG